MEKIDIYKQPIQIVEYHKGVYHPDPSVTEESFPFTVEVIKIPSANDTSVGEITWDDDVAPPIELLAEEKIQENIFQIKWKI